MRNQTIARWLAVSVVLILFGCNRSGPSSNSTNSNGNSASNAAQTPPPPPAPPVVIPAGTLLAVTLDETISTKTNNSGDRFAASLAEPVTLDGNQVILAGTKAVGTVVQAQAAGRVKGGAILALTLDSLTLNGAKYSIETREFEEVGKGRGKRTAIGGGGGAAFGAIVGALAGGGKGAAIGAVAGGGAGTAGAAYTGKRDITLPAESRLHFKLAQPLTINP
jgi:hypothetical protein